LKVNGKHDSAVLEVGLADNHVSTNVNSKSKVHVLFSII